MKFKKSILSTLLASSMLLSITVYAEDEPVDNHTRLVEEKLNILKENNTVLKDTTIIDNRKIHVLKNPKLFSTNKYQLAESDKEEQKIPEKYEILLSKFKNIFDPENSELTFLSKDYSEKENANLDIYLGLVTKVEVLLEQQLMQTISDIEILEESTEEANIEGTENENIEVVSEEAKKTKEEAKKQLSELKTNQVIKEKSEDKKAIQDLDVSKVALNLKGEMDLTKDELETALVSSFGVNLAENIVLSYKDVDMYIATLNSDNIKGVDINYFIDKETGKVKLVGLNAVYSGEIMGSNSVKYSLIYMTLIEILDKQYDVKNSKVIDNTKEKLYMIYNGVTNYKYELKIENANEQYNNLTLLVSSVKNDSDKEDDNKEDSDKIDEHSELLKEKEEAKKQ